MQRIANAERDLADALEAIRVLVPLVRGEYPEHYSLRDIAETWSAAVTIEQLAALSRLDRGELLIDGIEHVLDVSEAE
jgi:hypothetical protein